MRFPVALDWDTIKNNQLTSALETVAMALSPKSYLEQLQTLQQIKELKNGRMAMIAVMGLCFNQVIPGALPGGF